MSRDNQFAHAIRLLTDLNIISQSTHPSNANLEFMQNELFLAISTMVIVNRENAMDQRMQQAIASRNVTVRRPRQGPYTQGTQGTAFAAFAAPLSVQQGQRAPTRYNPLEKTKVIAKKKLDEPCPTECAICQETPKYKDAVCTDCIHYYCKTCWSGWMTTTGSNKSCPTCRKDLPRVTSYKARASTTKRSHFVPLETAATPQASLLGPLIQSGGRPVMIIESESDEGF